MKNSSFDHISGDQIQQDPFLSRNSKRFLKNE